jgi:tRNA(fMet)-specific endonuclease VapC
MEPALIDTDILSEIHRGRNATVKQKANAYLRQHHQFGFSAFTRYEVLRGLKEKNAARQVQRFTGFCSRSLIFSITDDVLDRAADLWVQAFHGGHPRNDADLIIAATAMETRRVLATGNTSHFSWISGLVVEDWRQP